jgi:hypothetical protein
MTGKRRRIGERDGVFMRGLAYMKILSYINSSPEVKIMTIDMLRVSRPCPSAPGCGSSVC